MTAAETPEDQVAALLGVWARPFRLTLDGQRFDGAEFPSGRVVIDHPDVGLAMGALSMKDLLASPSMAGALLDWPGAEEPAVTAADDLFLHLEGRHQDGRPAMDAAEIRLARRRLDANRVRNCQLPPEEFERQWGIPYTAVHLPEGYKDLRPVPTPFPPGLASFAEAGGA